MPKAKKKLTVRQIMNELIAGGEKDRGTLIKTSARKARVSTTRASQVFRELSNGRPTLPGAKTDPRSRDMSKISVTAADLVTQEKLNPTELIKQHIDTLGDSDCVYDDIFQKEMDISKNRWRIAREDPSLLVLQVQLSTPRGGKGKRRVWCNAVCRAKLLELDGVTAVPPADRR